MSFADRNTERVQKQVHQYEDACKQGIKNTLRTLAETEDIAMHTAVQLNQQTEQLHRIEDQTDQMDHTLDRTQYLLTGLKSFWGRTKNFVRGAPDVKAKDVRRATAPSEESNRAMQEVVVKNRETVAAGNFAWEEVRVGTLIEDERAKELERQASEDRDLDQIIGMLDNLKARSETIAQTLGFQADQLETIGTKTARVDLKMKKQHVDVKNLLKK